MKHFLIVLFVVALSSTTKAQMISVTGGNLNLHGKNKGYIEVEAMQHITKNVAAHISYTKTIGGYDIAMAGGRVSFLDNRFGTMLSACYIQNHPTMAMVGFDARPFNNSQINIVYSQTTNFDLKTIGLKFPIFNNHNKGH